jgi:hypothetical protein
VSDERLHEHLRKLFPDATVISIEPLGADSDKAAGYGRPLHVRLQRGGAPFSVVWRLGSDNEFGHDRRSDRAGNQLLAYDDFGKLPAHVRALDVGVMTGDGGLTSIGGGELYLITDYAPGTIYAEDLRRVAREGRADERDLARCSSLAAYLTELHVPIADPQRYRRAIRDLVGHGEGIFGMIDGYRDGVPGAPLERLFAIERRCVEWRWRLRGYEHRLARTHGDFHPFNVVFDGDRFALLDASRGCAGDPADDVTAMAINYLLFALDAPDGWRGLGPLWRRFWATYVKAHPDGELFLVAPPYFSWRALVVCNPRFYPHLGERSRDALLGLAERTLDAGRFDPAWGEELFA